jgi:hypothetical protein
MPTLVKFASGTDIKRKEDFDKVNSQLSSKGSGLFNRERGQRVVVYRENALYIEDLEGVSHTAAGFA